jgi:hypothetical protein
VDLEVVEVAQLEHRVFQAQPVGLVVVVVDVKMEVLVVQAGVVALFYFLQRATNHEIRMD